MCILKNNGQQMHHGIIGKPHMYYFKQPHDITIAGKTFKDIVCRDKRQYLQNGDVHTVNYLTGKNAKYSVYKHDGKIEHLGIVYNSPELMEFNGKKYYITFGHTNDAGNMVYSQINPKTYGVTKIEVNESGKVLHIHEPVEKRIARSLKNLVSNIGKKLKP